MLSHCAIYGTLQNLPKDVKPLLRDPSQTSRTGGNSKRYVYAYRGVCRQARKGHDRWQAQISFNGFNHYLGTFDSEWDAAAIYGKFKCQAALHVFRTLCMSLGRSFLQCKLSHSMGSFNIIWRGGY